MRPADDEPRPALSENETVEFLSNGASYGLAGEPVERIETHCSIVFLIGDRAYKLKRPIAFSALDYTSVERRETACRREIELNRRTAPDLYLGLRSIRRDERGGLGFAGAGPVVDWLVVMRRFEQTDLFDHLAAEDRLSAALARDLAEEIARFHARAAATHAYGGREGLMRAIEQNRRDQSTVEAVLGKAAIDNLFARSVGVLDRVGPLLDRRRVGGRVRVCHGDLRLPNICLYRGRPTLFDAIEFADEPVCIDVLYDLAFLLMDLRQRGLHTSANVIFNRYLDVTADDEGLPALPQMMSTRAGTRAFALAGSSLRKSEPDERRRLAAAAQDLMAFALSLLEVQTPRVVAIGGGTEQNRNGLAAALSPTFDPAPGARIFENGERSAAALRKKMSEVLDAGYTALFARPFDRATEQKEISDLAAAQRIPFVGLWLDDIKVAPAEWKVVDPATGTEAAMGAVRRLLEIDAPPRGSGDPSLLRREAGETLRNRD